MTTVEHSPLHTADPAFYAQTALYLLGDLDRTRAETLLPFFEQIAAALRELAAPPEPTPPAHDGYRIGTRNCVPKIGPPAMWAEPQMRLALAHRDLGAAYRLLQRNGVSQRRIAAATGQSQSEISEILKGRRVASYDVLVRVAAGLGVPRGWMGLEHSDTIGAHA